MAINKITYVGTNILKKHMVVSPLRNFANRKVVARGSYLIHEDATIHALRSRLPRIWLLYTTRPVDKVHTCGPLYRYLLCLNIG